MRQVEDSVRARPRLSAKRTINKLELSCPHRMASFADSALIVGFLRLSITDCRNFLLLFPAAVLEHEVSLGNSGALQISRCSPVALIASQLRHGENLVWELAGVTRGLGDLFVEAVRFHRVTFQFCSARGARMVSQIAATSRCAGTRQHPFESDLASRLTQTLERSSMSIAKDEAFALLALA